MRKTIVVGLTLLLCLSARLALAEERIVKLGDCLSVIGQQSGVPWREIAKVNKVKAPKYTIYVGQKLTIPRSGSIIAKPVVESAVADSGYLAEIRSLQAQITELEQKLKTAAEASVKKAESAPVVTEKKQVAQAAVVGQTVKQETVAVAETKQQTVVAPVIATVKTEIPVKADVPVAADATEQVEKSYAENDKFDMYVIGGGWTSSGNKDTSTGGYGQLDLSYRPFTTKVFGHDAGIGGFFKFETGSGATGKWDFRWNKFIFGPNFKLYGDHWDATTKLGWSRQWDFGVSDKQTTDSAYISQYVNIEQDHGIELSRWLRQTELMFSATIPFSASRESTRDGKTFGQSLPANDKSVYGIDIRQSIYDFYPNKNLRLAPGVLLGGGFEGRDTYGKVGPFVKAVSYGQDIVILDLPIYKIKSSVDGNRWYGSLMLKPNGIVKAIKAANITKPDPEDLVYKPVR
ncbi:MAG: LysM peptidoglycan-binding domain-containing protein [bacterium]|nr:LysM peptidoglycan-binding domain-containing protein [bacterium]